MVNSFNTIFKQYIRATQKSKFFVRNFRLQKIKKLNWRISSYFVKTLSESYIFFVFAIWTKARVIYYVNNWVYTTNHKRIAVNYFWFVIFSGICGMVLATIIRLEMAYPGVGILAGDSLQYLSVVTAHAVIMVFFMIMPLLFGAFGNFLLPTQLGVHDVAFPRLNSVAFWFLPGGLLMLCQLVCLDRRYQRMNCFNIREVQTLLKARFYADLLNENHQHLFLNRTAPNVRFKLQDTNFLNSSTLLLNKYGALQTINSRNQEYGFSASSTKIPENFVSYSQLFSTDLSKTVFWYEIIKRFSTSNLNSSTPNFLIFGAVTLEKFMFSLTSFGKNCYDFLRCVTTFINPVASSKQNNMSLIFKDPFTGLLGNIKSVIFEVFEWLSTINTNKQRLLTIFTTFFTEQKITWHVSSQGFTNSFNFSTALRRGLNDFFSIVYSHASLNYIHFSLFFTFSGLISHYNFFFREVNFQVFSFTQKFNYFFNSDTNKNFTNLFYKTNHAQPKNSVTTVLFGKQETASDYRNQRLQNPIFRYDFKLGNYMSEETKRKVPHLYTTVHDLTTGLRKPYWFNSPEILKFLYGDFGSYLKYFNPLSKNTVFLQTSTKLFTQLHSLEIAQDTFWTNVSYTTGFYNPLFLLSENVFYMNKRWTAVNALEQKFCKMFLSNSMQQRVHANWRELKFTREAWRCRLLAARHQASLHRRYLDEDSTVWAVERNAKDVLPGWAMITPFAARTRFTAIGKVDLGLMGVFLVLNSSIVASSNFIVTYRYLSTLNNRKMRDARSFFTEGVLVASWMMIAANPMLAIGILMLLSDRHWQTSFFDYSGGGDTVMFQHMFWFFGHPEVYVIMIPTFGFNNTILSFYLRKRVSARASLLYSMYTIAFLGFFVWGHHMYMVGLAHTTRMLFSTLTVMISVPAATKLMHWCVTLVNSTFVVELPFLFQLLFIFFFVSGGISGMAVAHTGMDILFHDSFYVVGHFHVMLAGAAMFGSFGAFYFYFPAIWGVKYSRIWGYLHCIYYLLGQLMTVIPMMWLGYSGMPRRVLDYPASMGGWHAITSAGHLLSVAGMIAFFVMIFDSLRQGRAATRNSFGIPRFNTRLNFYQFTGSKMWYLQRKNWYLLRFNHPKILKLNSLKYTNFEYLEVTLFSYMFKKKMVK